jgi:predicted metal-dependent HD superfamily phosphohydrolase
MVIQNKWRRLLKGFNIDEKIINQTFSEIATVYRCQGRYYHNLTHIQEMLQIVYNLNSKYKLDVSIVFATWFHDIVYDTQANDNEERSADYARNLLSSLNIPSSTIDKTCSLILTTKYHKASEDDFETKILVDADLAILGSNPKRYSEYMLLIRQEYAWVPEQEYIVARKRALISFMERAYIFHTPELLHLEASARQNIKEEINHLNSGFASKQWEQLPL